MPPALAAILVPSPSIPPPPRVDDPVLVWLPDADTEVPEAFADLGDVAAAPARPVLDAAAAARAASMAWPPLEEELDAVEVIDLEAVRSKSVPPMRPPAARGAGVAPFARPAAPPTAAPTGAAASLAWPPPADEVDAIAMIDLQAPGGVHGAVALAPVERSRPVARGEPAVSGAPDASRAPAGHAPGTGAPLRWGAVVGVAVVVAAAAGVGYVATRRQLTAGPPSVPGASVERPVVEPSAGSARTALADADVTPPADRGVVGVAPPAPLAGPAPEAAERDQRRVAELLAASRRLLASGDRAGAIRLALPAASDPETSRFIASVLQGAASATEAARASTLARVPGSEALDPFKSAQAQEADAVGAWRQGQFERALDLFGRATRSYGAVEAPVVAGAPVPVGVTGRAADVPPVAARERAATADVAPVPAAPVPPVTNTIPLARDGRTTPALPAPAAEARPVAVSRPDESGVRRMLEAYRSAFDRLDAAAASAVVPSLDAKALARAFNGLASQRLDFERCDVEMQVTTARATCVGRAASVPKVGSSKPRVDPRRWSFALERRGDDWRITSAQVAQR